MNHSRSHHLFHQASALTAPYGLSSPSALSLFLLKAQKGPIFSMKMTTAISTMSDHGGQ